MPQSTYHHPLLLREIELPSELVDLVKKNTTSVGDLFEKGFRAWVKVEEGLKCEIRNILNEIFTYKKTGMSGEPMNLRAVLVLLELGVMTEQQVRSVFMLYQRDVCFRGFLEDLEGSLYEVYKSDKLDLYEYGRLLKGYREFIIDMEAEARGDLSLKEAQVAFIERSLAILENPVMGSQFPEMFIEVFTCALRKYLSQLQGKINEET